MSISLREKVRGMFLGTAIGDALGMPVETFTPEMIGERYPETGGKITKYIQPTGHKWFDGQSAGTTTDDTQLTLAVAEGLINGKGSINDLVYQVHSHVDAMKVSTAGWGGTTRRAVQLLAKGQMIDTGQSGKGRGKGNGCAMKISPLAVCMVSYVKKNPKSDTTPFISSVYQYAMRLSLMTHKTTMAVQSAFAQLVAASYCLSPFCDFGKGTDFDPEQFIHLVVDSVDYGRKLTLPMDIDHESDFSEQIEKIRYYADCDIDYCRNEFGGCSCLITHSLPPTYIIFLKNPFSIESLFDIVNAGGDTDTNGAMLGALLGALNGTQVFPQHLIDGLVNKDNVINTADRLCDVFGI